MSFRVAIIFHDNNYMIAQFVWNHFEMGGSETFCYAVQGTENLETDVLFL